MLNALALVEPSFAGLTIIENALSTVFEFAVARKVKLDVVELVIFVGSPLITPVDVLSEVPAGNQPD